MAAKPTFSSTPASVIYAQSWPVPTSDTISQRYFAKASSNSQKNSHNNSPWISKPKQNTARPQKAVSPANVHPKSYNRSWASSMLSNHYPGWVENDDCVMDMAEEFKLTLQMFRKLTEQVQEVDEQLNSGRKAYSFKHYFSGRGRNRMRTYTPEIPMTNEEYQSCNNLGIRREQWQPPSQFGTSRKTEKASKSKVESWPLTLLSNMEKRKQNWQTQASLDDENCNTNQSSRFENEDLEANLSIRNESNLPYSDGDISWSSCLEFSDEDNRIGLGYVDPLPEDWEVRKLEELESEYCSAKGECDPFMIRFLQLHRLEIETVEQEKGNGTISNSVPCLENGVDKVTISNKGKKVANTKKKNSKTNGAVVEKNPRRLLKKSSSSSLHDFGEQKAGKILNKDSCKEKDKKQTQKQFGGKRTECKSSKGKRRVQSCKTRPTSYSSSVTYDILELATTFDPPCKERMRLNPRPVTAKSAKSKGMIPGKTWTSQRRFSLTSGQSLQNLPSDDGDTVVSKSRMSSAKRCRKRKTKRCSSSKL